MAHSIQLFEGRSEIFNDLDLLALHRLACIAVKQSTTRFPNGEAILSSWSNSVEHYGPGLIELDLDPLLAPPHFRSEFLALLDDIKDRVLAFGDEIPAPHLDEPNPPHGVLFGNYKAVWILDTIAQLRRLILGTIEHASP